MKPAEKKKIQTIKSIMSAVLRSGGLLVTQPTVNVATKHMIEECGIPDLVKKLNRDDVRLARVIKDEMVAPSKMNPLTRIVAARVLQLGAYPSRNVIGNIQADLLSKSGFDKWKEVQKVDKYDRLWDVILKEREKAAKPDGSSPQV